MYFNRFAKKNQERMFLIAALVEANIHGFGESNLINPRNLREQGHF
jgi:hypothetical protein